MSTQHTPGPWSGGKQISLRAYQCEKFGFSIAFVSNDRDGETEANARLISAAPDLLKALHACLKKGSRWHPADPVVLAARAAIAKATT